MSSFGHLNVHLLLTTGSLLLYTNQIEGLSQIFDIRYRLGNVTTLDAEGMRFHGFPTANVLILSDANAAKYQSGW
jgi:hypothetical protein